MKRSAARPLPVEPRKPTLADKLVTAARVQIQQACAQADRSAERLRALAESEPHLKLVKVSR